MTWIIENLANIIICMVLIAVVTAIIAGLVKKKKRGKPLCGCECGCSSCPVSSKCRDKT